MPFVTLFSSCIITKSFCGFFSSIAFLTRFVNPLHIKAGALTEYAFFDAKCIQRFVRTIERAPRKVPSIQAM